MVAELTHADANRIKRAVLEVAHGVAKGNVLRYKVDVEVGGHIVRVVVTPEPQKLVDAKTHK